MMKYAANAVPKIATFIPIVCAAFFLRVKPGLHEREAGLHEHHERAGDADPQQVGVDREHAEFRMPAGGDGVDGERARVAITPTSTTTSPLTSANRRAQSILTLSPCPF